MKIKSKSEHKEGKKKAKAKEYHAYVNEQRVRNVETWSSEVENFNYCSWMFACEEESG
jgi:hypothetical protein